ncbi:site-specific integrase [Actinomadura sp. B10D3]|uniref:site-specific integrase n=1 Tax=Actinomadura sp. B10D3 TaxID=3153557 RepID=UPI00325F1363
MAAPQAHRSPPWQREPGQAQHANDPEWLTTLANAGVGATSRAKAYRLLGAVLMTAVVEDKFLSRNPCQVLGAGTEHAEERSTLTIAQVFELAERVGARPVGNFRKLDSGEYRLRYRVKDGIMRRFPQTFATRAAAERALWKMAEDGHADVIRDERLRAFILLATFASLRWGEITALRRCDIDLTTRTVRVRHAYVEQANGRMLLGPPKSRAGVRTVTIPAAIVPPLTAHLNKYTEKEAQALIFTGLKGGPLRRSGFNEVTNWRHVVNAFGVPNLHFHDLRHTGNQLAADMGVSTKNLMARMGHDNERAALRYQHRSAKGDRIIADGLDALVRAERDQDEGEDDGAGGTLVPVA